MDIDVGSVAAARRSDRFIEFRPLVVDDRSVQDEHRDNAALDTEEFPRRAQLLDLAARITQFVFFVCLRRFAFCASLMHDVDHFIGFMVATMRSFV